MKKMLFFLPLLLGFLTSVSGQVISYPVGKEAEAISRGLDETWLTVKIDFTGTCNSSNVQILLGESGAPGEIRYIPGSLQVLDGTITISQGDISNLARPNFTLGPAANGQFVEFRIRRHANGGESQSAKDHVIITGGCSASETDPNVNSYNLLAPGLAFMPVPSIPGVTVGDTRTRILEIRQGGNGCMDEIYVEMTYEAGLELQDLSVQGGASVIPYLSAAESTPLKKVFRIPASAFETDNLFCNGEVLLLEEVVKLTDCVTAKTIYQSAYIDHLSALHGETTPIEANITPNSTAPNLQRSIVNPDYSYCMDANVKYQTIRYTNTAGSGPATNIVLTLSGNANLVLDYSQNWVIRDHNGNAVETVVPNTAGPSKVTFTAATTLGAFTPGSCDLTRQPTGVNINLGNLVLAPGESVSIEVPTRSRNYACYDCNLPSSASLNAGATYAGTCGPASFTLANSSVFSTGSATATALAAAPLVVRHNDVFDFNIFFTSLSLRHADNSSGNTYIFLELGDSFVYEGGSNVTIKGVSYPVTAVGNRLRIGPLNKTTNVTSLAGADLTVSLRAVCGSSGEKEISAGLEYKYSDCQPDYVKTACIARQIRLRCPGPGDCAEGGATPISFRLERGTFGYVDADNNGVADGPTVADASTPGVKLKHAVVGDDVIGVWEIMVSSNTSTNTDFNHLYIDVPIGTSTLGLAAHPTRTVEVELFPSGGGPAITSCTATLLNPGTTSGSLHYEISNTCNNGVWKGGDSLVVKIPFLARGTTSGDFVTDPIVYASYNPHATPQTSTTSTDVYTCDVASDYIRVSELLLNTQFNQSNINVCGSEVSLTMTQGVSMYPSNYFFPNEVRNFMVPDELDVTIPDGMTYRAGSAYIIYTRHGTPGVSVGNQSLTSEIIDGTHVFASGNDLQFRNLSNLFTSGGGSVIQADEYGVYQVRFFLEPTCETPAGNFAASHEFRNIGNGINYPESGWSRGATNQASRYIFNKPNLVINSPLESVSSNSIGQWAFNVQNSSGVNAPNSYLYIPAGDWTDLQVKIQGSIVSPNADGYYSIGSFEANGTRNIEVTGRYIGTSCNPSLPVYAGWGCTAPSGSFSPGVCHVQTLLPMSFMPSAIQLSVAQQPVGTVELCSENIMVFNMNSSEGGYVNNPEFRVNPTNGFNIVKGEIEYPAGSGNWEIVTPAMDGGIYVYAVEDHSGVSELGLPGTFESLPTEPRSANLRITYDLGCSFVSGSRLIVSQRGWGLCETPATGYDGAVRTNALKVTGAGDGSSYNMTVGVAPVSIDCEGNFELTVDVMPVLNSSQDSDILHIQLPHGIEYLGGNYASATNFTFVDAVDNVDGKLIRIKVAEGIGAGTSSTVVLGLATTVEASCGINEISVDIRRTFPPLTCPTAPGGICSQESVVILADDIKQISVNRATVALENLVRTGGVYQPGATVTYTLDVINPASSDLALPASTEVSFYCGTNLLATLPLGTSVAVGSTQSFTFNVGIPTTGAGSDCDGTSITAVISPDEGACVCDEAIITLEDPMPVTLVGFDARVSENAVKLNWATTSEVNSAYFGVEHSLDGKYWLPIGKVNARNNSVAKAEYSFTDASPAQGINYYRLKMTDLDGSFEYSPIRSVVIVSEGFAKLYPNPATDVVVISPTKGREIKTIEVLDSGGRLVHSTRAVSTMNVSQLSGGIYVLRIIYQDGGTDIQRFIKK